MGVFVGFRMGSKVDFVSALLEPLKGFEIFIDAVSAEGSGTGVPSSISKNFIMHQDFAFHIIFGGVRIR